MERLNRNKGAFADARKINLWLAEQVGRDPVFVSKWWTNTWLPYLQTLAKRANVLKVDMRDLLNIKVQWSIK